MSTVTSKKPIGCLGRLLVLLIVAAVFYWLFLRPINYQFPRQVSDLLPGAANYHLTGKVAPAQSAQLVELARQSAIRPSILAVEGQIQYLSVSVPVGGNPQTTQLEQAYIFLEQHRAIFQIQNPRQELVRVSEEIDLNGDHIIRFRQSYQNYPVHDSNLVITLTRTGIITTVNANYLPNIDLPTQGPINARAAETVARQAINLVEGQPLNPATLEIYGRAINHPGQTGYPPRLAWFITLGDNTGIENWLVIVDALDSSVLNKIRLNLDAGGELDLEVYEWGENDKNYIKVMEESGPILTNRIPHEYSRNAFNQSWTVYRYYYETFNRDSFDGRGAMVVNEVNTDTCDQDSTSSNDYAFYNPNNNKIYFCKEFTAYPDVMTHEYTHAVANSLKAQGYVGESRELGEALADLFAAFHDDTAPWQISWPLSEDKVLRNLENPAPGFPTQYKDRYCSRDLPSCENKCPDMLNGYKETYADCGHVNSLVFSHAVYTMSKEANTSIGLPREKLQYLFYYALVKNKITNTTGPRQAAESLYSTCLSVRNHSELIKGKPLSSPFNDQDCKVIGEAFTKAGLIDKIDENPIVSPLPTYDPSWIEKLILSIRLWIDDRIGDLRRQAELKLQEAFNYLNIILQQLMQELANNVMNNFLNFLAQLLNQCCMAGFSPLGWLVIPALVIKNRKKPVDGGSR